MSHLPLFTSSPTFPLTSQTPTVLLEHDEHSGPDERSHCDDLRQSGGFQSLPQVMSPKSSRPMSSTPKRSILKTSSAEGLSLTEILLQIRIKSTKDLWEVLLLKIWKNLGKLVLTWLTSSHRCIPNTTRWKALQTRTLKMENYEECPLPNRICRIEKTMNPFECQSQRRNLPDCYWREKQVQNLLKLIEGKAWWQSSSQEPSAPGKPAALFYFEVKNREINSRVLFSKTLTRQIWEDLFLKTIKIICSVKQNLKRQEHQVGSLNNCISELQQHAHAPVIGITGRTSRIHWISTRTSTSTRRIIYEGKGSSRYSDPKEKWRDLKNFESTNSRHKNWEKIMRQYKGSPLSCRKCRRKWIPRCRIHSQWEIVLLFQSACNDPSSRSMLSRDKRLPLDTWSTSGLQKTFLVINFLCLIHPEIIIKEFTLAYHKENEDQINRPQCWGHLSKEMTNKIETQFQCRCLRECRRPWVRQYCWTFRRTYGLTAKTADIGAAIRQIPHSTVFFVLENNIQESSDYLFWEVSVLNQSKR